MVAPVAVDKENVVLVGTNMRKDFEGILFNNIQSLLRTVKVRRGVAPVVVNTELVVLIVVQVPTGGVQNDNNYLPLK